MKVRKRTVDNQTTIAVAGTLRATPRSIQLFNEINAGIGTTTKSLVLDLGQVHFADSLWLGFLVTLTLKCRDRNIPLTIPAVSRQLWHAITLSHLEKVLPTPSAIERLKPVRASRVTHANESNGNAQHTK
jgi:anti-anti-sigma factor